MLVLDCVAGQLLPVNVALNRFGSNDKILLKDLLLSHSPPLLIHVNLEIQAFLVEADVVFVFVQLSHGFFCLLVKIIIKWLRLFAVTLLLAVKEKC